MASGRRNISNPERRRRPRTTVRRRPGFYSYLVEHDKVEEAAEYKRLFYVAATRAADMLYLSGASSKKGASWMAMAQQAAESGAWTGSGSSPTHARRLESHGKET